MQLYSWKKVSVRQAMCLVFALLCIQQHGLASSGVTINPILYLNAYASLPGKDKAVTAGEEYLLDLPSEYLKSILDPGEVAEEERAPAPPYGVSWLPPSDFQIAENPELLNQTSQIIASIQQGAGFLAQFDGDNLLNVPFGFDGNFSEFYYQIGFDNIQLFTDYAELDVVAALHHPKLKDTLYFAGANLKYNNRSGFVGDAMLALVQDFPIEVNQGKTAIVFRGYRPQQDAGTFLRFSCEGIEEISFGLSVAFNPEVIVPVDSSQKFVQAFTQFQYRPSSGFMIDDLSITPFYFKKYKDFAFSLDNLALDLDETNTSVSYINQYFNEVSAAGGSPGVSYNEWTGFYCSSFKLMIGGGYMAKNSGEPIILSGENIVIDDLGFSSLLSVAKPNMVALNDGNMGGWSFSMDSVSLKVLANELKGFGFAGLIHIPVLDDKKDTPPELPKPGDESAEIQAKPAACVAYSAMINLDSSHLELNVKMVGDEDLTIPMFVADLTLTEGSHIYVKTGDNFTIKTHLNGNVSFNGMLSGGNSSVKSPAFSFDGLMVSNRAGFFGVKGFYPGPNTSANLGIFKLTFGKVSITDHKPQEFNQQVKKLRLEDLSLEFGALSDGDALTISSTIEFFFQVKPSGNKQKWVGKGLRIEKFEFEGVLPGTDKVMGSLAFYYDHPTYKDGFAGKGYVKFKAVPLEIDMACMFGNTGDEGYKYSYVDVSAKFGGTGDGGTNNAAFKVYSMVGGYYKNMRREEIGSFSLGQPADSLELGGKYPQNKYEPQLNAWGIKGGIIAKVGSAAIIGLRLEYESYESDEQGQTTRFFLEGLLELMPEGGQESTESPATGTLVAENEVPADDQMEDSEADAFMGTGMFGGYIRIEVIENNQGKTFNAALGVHGTVSAIKFGFYGEYYKDPNSWHLFIGKPEREKRVTVGYSVQLLKVVEAELVFKAYFMIGNSPFMPTSLPPPISISDDRQDMLVKAYNKLRANSNSNVFENSTGLQNGNSIAFGAYFGINVSFTKFVTVEAGADVGFDVLLSKFTPDCDNTGDAGLNSWYLLGQFYAGVAAKVGFKLFGKLWTIFGAGVGLVVQAGAFEPTAGIGAWIIQYKILWVDGEATGTFEFGETCVDYMSTFNPEALVSQVRASSYVGPPQDNLVSMNSDFVLDCAIKPNQIVTEQLIDFATGDSENLRLKLELDAELRYQGGAVIETFNRNEGSALVLAPKQMLTPGEQVRLTIDGRVWNHSVSPPQLYEGDDGDTYEWDTIIIFTVDPNGILGLQLDDLAASYPVKFQEYFHIDEYDEIIMDFGKEIPTSGATFSSRLEVKGSPAGSGSQTSQSQASVGRGDGSGPSSSSNNSNSSSSSWQLQEEGNIAFSSDGKKLEQDAFTLWQPNREYRWIIKATLDSGEEEDIIELQFNTSKFRTFQDKAEHLSFKNASLVNTTSAIPIELQSDDEPVETFGNNLTRATYVFDKSSSNGYLSEVWYSWVPYGACKYFQCQGEFDDFILEPTGGNNDNYQYTFLSIPVGNFSEVPMPRGSGDNAFSYHIRPTLMSKYNSIVSTAASSNLMQCQDTGLLTNCSSQQTSQGPNENQDPQSSYNFPKYKNTKYPVKLKYYIPGFKRYSSSERTVQFSVL